MKQLHTYFQWQVLLFVLSMPWVCPSFAQDLHVVSFEQRMEPMTVPMQQRDLNGDICALVKVQLPTPGCKFEGNVIASRFEVSEYWVYLSDGSLYLNIKCPGHPTLFVDFSQYDIPGVVSKSIYYLQLDGYGTVALNPADASPVRRTSEESVRQMKIIRDAVIKLGVQNIGPFMNGIAPVTKGGKVAFVDKSGNLLTAFSFDGASNRVAGDNFYLSNSWVVERNGLLGIIDSTGKLIADCQYQYLEPGVNNLIVLCKDNFMVDKLSIDVRKLMKADFDVINALTGELIASKVDSEVLWHLLTIGSLDTPRARENKFVNGEGKLLFGQKYKRVYPFLENLACVSTKGNDYVVIDKNGEPLAHLPSGFYLEKDYFSSQEDFYWYRQNVITGVHDGLLAVSRRGTDKKGYVNMMGELAIPCQYDEAGPFSNGLAAVKMEMDIKKMGRFSLPSASQWCYINKNGEVVFRHPKSLFMKCGIFKNGVAVGEFNKPVSDTLSNISYTHAIYDASGKILMKGTRTLHNIVQYYDDCFKYKLYPVQGICSDGSYIFGYINSNFELVIPYQFSFVEPFKDEFTSVTGEKGCGLLDSYGNVVWLSEEENKNVLEEQ